MLEVIKTLNRPLRKIVMHIGFLTRRQFAKLIEDLDLLKHTAAVIEVRLHARPKEAKTYYSDLFASSLALDKFFAHNFKLR